MRTISVLGLGAMGSRIAANLLKAGYPLTVYNRTPERALALQSAGALVAATPRAAATGADLVISMIRDDQASRTLWLHPQTGAIHGLHAGSIALESSTLSLTWVQELAEKIHTTGAAFAEAPVLGTRPQAEAQQLIYLVGGAATTLARIQDVLKTSARLIHHIGEIGSATAMKLAINSQYGVQVAIWAEMLALLEKYGIASIQAVALLNSLPTTSPAMQVTGSLMAARQYAPLFPIELVAKDFGYACVLAQALDVPTPTIVAVHALYTEAIERGYGNDNIVGVQQLFGS